jgi:wyosine [tRNA(Phe)-imidazoG37] synthetase (radical SAM superfamily)
MSPPDHTPNPQQPHSNTPLPTLQHAFASHPRLWRQSHYVYPVLSRRSQGLSIGINLNIDKACNFDCIYCCVDRSLPPPRKDIDLDQLRSELDQLLQTATSGNIWQYPPFNNAPADFRRINDIAFSGDGEPTTYPRFDLACAAAADLKRRHQLHDAKIIVITNATVLDRPVVQRALEILDHNQGEIWAKLEAGTQPYYQSVERTNVPLDRVLNNILACGRTRPLVIQSLFMTVRGTPIPDQEFQAYLNRIQQLIQQGCRIKLVQIYTVARSTAEPYVTALPAPHLDQLARQFTDRLPNLPVKTFYGLEP